MLIHLIHWVGSPDLGIVLLFALECSPPQPQIEQGNGRFRFFARHSKFSKGALRAVGAVAWAAASGGMKSSVPPTVHGKAVGDCALRCAGLFYLLRMRQQCCKLTSCAARAAKGQQERERARKQRKQKHRKKQQIVAGCFRCGFLLSPPAFCKGKWPFSLPPRKKIRLRRPLKWPLYPAFF